MGACRLFAAGDLAIASLYTLVDTTSSPRAEGVTWSVGPGLRFWLDDHLSLAYLTRLRWTRLEGPGRAPRGAGRWITAHGFGQVHAARRACSSSSAFFEAQAPR